MTDGFLNILKPPGMSSHDVVSAIRRILHTKRVGHAGTLDPGAAGVLPIAVGRATRMIEFLSGDKSYRAEVKLGMATDSGDLFGTPVEQVMNFSMPAFSEIAETMEGFQGKITQVPPIYSAIKINGKRACDLARQDIKVEIPARDVEIMRLELLQLNEQAQTFLMDVDCSKGTYIRTLCMDIGSRLGIPAVMSFLLRTRVGAFQLEDSYTLEELRQAGEAAVLSAEECFLHIPRYDLSEHREKAFCNGLSTRELSLKTNQLFSVFCNGRFLGMARYDQSKKAVCPIKVYKN